SGAYRRFYMHRTGHWLGLDVHDAGEYGSEGRWKPLGSGMVLTVEPGIYVRPGEGVPEASWNIGIRIEDDGGATPHGAGALAAEAPKRISEIESVMTEG